MKSMSRENCKLYSRRSKGYQDLTFAIPHSALGLEN